MRGHAPFPGPLSGQPVPQRGGHHGPQRGDKPTVTTEQTATVDDDGSVAVNIVRTVGDTSTTRTVDLARDAEGDITITETRGERTLSQIISAGEDGGVDVTTTTTLPSGDELVRTLEIDLATDGELVITSVFNHPDGDTFTHERTVAVEQFLGAADESLSVAEVAEAFLEHAGVDVSLVGVAEFLNADLVAGS